ncbi:MAG: MFS transporter [Planctomycetes bacterium]|nr:MFS transporter [Planctomycetota bacterium]
MDSSNGGAVGQSASGGSQRWLFWACFIALVATSSAFVTRFAVLPEWGRQFNLTAVQMGEIGGAGVWPFAVSIILFSLVVDSIGYGTAMAFAFICHVAYGIIVVLAPGVLAPAGASAEAVAAGQNKAYWLLYIGSFILALGNGTVEAVINPVVATMFSKEKTKWLNILHAGWPAGLVGAGIVTIAMGGADWRYKVGLIFIPAVLYGLMMLGRKFPVQERVAAGGSYLGMLQEFGVLAALLVVPLIVRQVASVFGLSVGVEVAIDLVALVGFGVIVRAPGSIMLFVLMLIMMPLATTEIGTDGWITALMEKEMQRHDLHPASVLVYTSFIMMVLRFFAGPIVHRLKPLGLLAVSALIAACGLFFLSKAAGIAILVAATLYGFGKTFFWPTMLGVVSEQCPRGGALTLNAVGGMGMLAVGVLGFPFIGLLQENAATAQLKKDQPALYAKVLIQKDGILGRYEAVDPEKAKTLLKAEQDTVAGVVEKAQHGALANMALFPCIMLVGYLLLMAYFASKGGYKPVELVSKPSPEQGG